MIFILVYSSLGALVVYVAMQCHSPINSPFSYFLWRNCSCVFITAFPRRMITL